jgi:TonB family protein
MSKNFSFKYLVCFCALVIFFIACNSNQSSNKAFDSSAVAPSDTAQTALPQEASPAQPEPSTTSQSASATPKPQSTAPTPQVSNPTKVIVKKEVKVIVAPMPVVTNTKVRRDKKGVYENAEANPTYPGGERAIESYIYNHLNYPRTALNTNTQGTVNISFVVNQNGSVSNAQVIGKSLGHGLDEEARRVVSLMHGWRPATVKGIPVKARITLPITFRLEK